MIDSLIGESVTLLENLGVAPSSLLTEEHEGSVWVAIVLPDHAKAFLKRYQTGEARDDDVGLHITLAYLGKGNQYTPEQIKRMRKAVEKVVARHAPLEFSITGSGRFAASPNSDGLVPVVLLPSAKGLAALRTDIVQAIERVGVELPGPFDFLPHICVGYVNDPEAAIPKVMRGEDTWFTTHVSFFVNPDRQDFELKGKRPAPVKESVRDVEEASIADRMKALLHRQPKVVAHIEIPPTRPSPKRTTTRDFWMGAYTDAKRELNKTQESTMTTLTKLIAEGDELLEMHQNPSRMTRNMRKVYKPSWADDAVTHTSGGGTTKEKKKVTHTGPWNVPTREGKKWSYLGSRTAKNRRVVKQKDHKADRAFLKRTTASDPEVKAATDKSSKSPSLNKAVVSQPDKRYARYADYDQDYNYTAKEYKNVPGSRPTSVLKKKLLNKMGQAAFNKSQSQQFKSRSK